RLGDPVMVDASASAEPLSPAPLRPYQPSGIASIDRIFANPHPAIDAHLRGEMSLAELLEIPGMDEDAGVTIEETLAWLHGRGPKCAPTG
ncbi:MAG: hypothetical protein ABI193_08125, partial [Minicystis sp.]